MKKNYTILAIDTSCDETSVAVTQNNRVMVNLISSQVDLHKKWGGVVPMIAKRAHQERIESITNEALNRFARFTNQESRVKNHDANKLTAIDAVAVTYGPGLAPALEVGVHFAKDVAKKYNKPLIAVNHMEGHLLSSFANNANGNGSKIKIPTTKIETISSSFPRKRESIKSYGSRIITYVPSGMTKLFPLLGLLISGGHTELVVMNDFGKYKRIGQTLDDAVGEAYDKVAKLLDLGYPGGPILEELAKRGDPFAYDLPIPMKGRADFNFSYSGLKTAVRYKVQDIKNEQLLDRQATSDMAASFQRVAVASLIDRLARAVKKTNPKGILLGGGVVSNLYVRSTIRKSMKQYNLPVYIPYSKKLFTDNAAMIGVAAYYQALRNNFCYEIELLDRVPNLHFN